MYSIWFFFLDRLALSILPEIFENVYRKIGTLENWGGKISITQIIDDFVRGVRIIC